MQLSISLLGPFHVTVNGEPLPESRTRKIEALLVYLAMKPDVAHRREVLVGLLFPDVPEETARTNLRQTVARLRKSLQYNPAYSHFLDSSRESIQFTLTNEISLDVAVFYELLEGCPAHIGHRDQHCEDCICQLENAISLYRSSFLDGFYIDGSNAFDDWLQQQRLSIEEMVIKGLRELAVYYEEMGEYETAVLYTQRLLEITPWNEESHCQFMRLLSYQGKRNAALLHYQQLQETLMIELGVEPMPATTTLYEHIRSSQDQTPRHLPQRPPQFIGRKPELSRIHRFLYTSDSRLLTLTGIGGIGKTQLATEAAWQIADRFAGPFIHGIYFIALADIPPPTNKAQQFDPIVIALAEALNFSFSNTRQPLQNQLFHFLHDKSILLILDNFEHLLNYGRSFIKHLLHQTTHPKLIITSRERLNLTNEWVLELEGLPYPKNDLIKAAELPHYGSIQLFLQLTQQTNLATPQNETTLRQIAHICRHLQGIPLAIRLAASLTRVLTPAEIASEIEQNLDTLNNNIQDLPRRHRSLRTIFEQTWAQLTPREQTLICALSIFQGGFTRQSAQAICNITLNELTSLHDKSFLQHNPQHQFSQKNMPASHYSIHEVLRQYTLEKLPKHKAIALRDRHSRYYLQLLHQQRANLTGSNQFLALEKIRRDIENIRIAWFWAVIHHHVEDLTLALDTLGLFYYMNSWFIEGVDIFAQTIAELTPANPQKPTLSEQVLLAKLIARQGWFTFLSGKQKEGKILLEKSLERLRPLDQPDALVYTLNFLAVACYTLGDFARARQLCQEAVQLELVEDVAYNHAITHNILSQIAYLSGQYEEARTYSQYSLRLELEMENHWSMGFSLANLGRVAYALQEYERANTYFRQSLAIRRKVKDERGQAICLNYLGDTALALEMHQSGMNYYMESLSICRDMGNLIGVAAALIRLGNLMLVQGETAVAHTYFMDGLRQAHSVGAMLQQIDAFLGIARLWADNHPDDAQLLTTYICQQTSAEDIRHQRAKELCTQLPPLKFTLPNVSPDEVAHRLLKGERPFPLTTPVH